MVKNDAGLHRPNILQRIISKPESTTKPALSAENISQQISVMEQRAFNFHDIKVSTHDPREIDIVFIYNYDDTDKGIWSGADQASDVNATPALSPRHTGNLEIDESTGVPGLARDIGYKFKWLQDGISGLWRFPSTGDYQNPESGFTEQNAVRKNVLKRQESEGKKLVGSLRAESPNTRSVTNPQDKKRPVENNFPLSLRTRARIMQYRCPEPLSQTEIPSLTEVFQDLSRKLVEKRQNDPFRPILFVGHDLGIIFIEKFIIESSKHEYLENKIAKSTAGIVFLLTSSAQGIKESSIGYLDFTVRESFVTMPHKFYYREFPRQGTKSSITSFVQDHLEKFKTCMCKAAEDQFSVYLKAVPDNGHSANPRDNIFSSICDEVDKILNSYHLMQLVSIGNIEKTKLHLEKFHVNPDAEDYSRQSALHVAVRFGRLRMVNLLIHQKVNVNKQDVNGNTPLHIALKSRSRRIDLILRLREAGGDVQRLNAEGKSVKDLAKGHTHILEALARPLLIGPRVEAPFPLIREVIKPTSPEKIDACRKLKATVAEFYLIEDQEKYIYENLTVREVLYGKEKPHEILRYARPLSAKVQCRWFHVPANNITWIHDLFGKLNIIKEPALEDQHKGPTAWAYYIRPHGQVFKAYRVGNTAEVVEDHTEPNSAGSKSSHASSKQEGKIEASRHSGYALFLPFLNFERTCDQREINSVITGVWDGTTESLEGSSVDIRDGRPSKSPTEATLAERGRRTTIHNSITSRSRSPMEHILEEKQSRNPSPGIVTYDMNKSATGESQSSTKTEKGTQMEFTFDHLAEEKSLINGYVIKDQKSSKIPPDSLHVRRTLDQSHYFMLKDTKLRDQDQVVLRGARRNELGISPKVPGDDSTFEEKLGRPIGQLIDQTIDQNIDQQWYNREETHDMVMVDQLWLWIFDDTIISSFPQSWSHVGDRDGPDVRTRIMNKLRDTESRHPIVEPADLASLIIKICVNTFNRRNINKGLRLHDYFESAVGRVADNEMELFRNFEKMCAKKENTAQTQELMKITKEVGLLRVTKDIRDELKMILHVSEDQGQVATDIAKYIAVQEETQMPRYRRNSHGTLTVVTPIVTKQSSSRNSLSSEQNEDFGDSNAPIIKDTKWRSIIDANTRDFKRMLEHANATYDSLNHLLDLKQKYANAAEASAARKGADASTRQNRIIMFFTIVTIIFGSLSFITTFFSLNVRQFPHDDNNLTSVTWQLGHIVGYVVGISMGVALPFIFVAYLINPMLDAKPLARKHLSGAMVIFLVLLKLPIAVVLLPVLLPIAVLRTIFFALHALHALHERRQRQRKVQVEKSNDKVSSDQV